MHVRQLAGERLADRALVVRVRVGMQQHDRDRLGLVLGDGARERRGILERAQDALRAGALGRRHAQLGRDEGRRAGGTEAVEVGAGLPAELDEIREALRRDEHRARSAAFEQRVRRDGHPVREQLDVAGRGAGLLERRADRRHHALGLIGGRRRRLRRDEPPAGGEHRVGEGPADVDTEQHALHLAARRSAGGRATTVRAERS